LSSSNRVLIIVDSPEQVDLVLRVHRPASFEILATNPKTAGVCRQKWGACDLLDELSLKERFRPINRWAYDQMISLIRRFASEPDKSLFLDSQFYDLKTFFIRPVKFILVLEPWLTERAFESIYVCGEEPSLLALTLQAYAGFREKITFVPSKKLEEKSRLPVREFLKKQILRWARADRNREARFFLKKTHDAGKKRWMVSGSLQHLKAVVEHLVVSKKCDLIFVETAFNYEKYRFCNSRGIQFHVWPLTNEFKNPFKGLSLFDAKEHPVIFEGRELTGVYNRIFQDLDRMGFLNPMIDPDRVMNFLKGGRWDGILLDEDYAMRRVFSIVAARLNIPCYVISHGVPSLLLLDEAEELKGGFYLSGKTLVHSEFEKRMYERAFYDPSKIIVTGTPRYDEICRLMGSQDKGHSRRPLSSMKTVLFCGTILVGYDLAARSSITSLLGQGCLSSEFITRYLHDVAEICAEDPHVRLWVKPHYADEREYRKILKDKNGGERLKILSHRENIFKLESEADMVISPVSSVLSEAILYRKPVVALDYADDDSLGPYLKSGLAVVVKDRHELHQAIRRCLYDPEYLKELEQARQKYYSHFAGQGDANGTQRAAEVLLKGV